MHTETCLPASVKTSGAVKGPYKVTEREANKVNNRACCSEPNTGAVRAVL